MQQEPGTPEEIRAFAREKYGAEFPIFEKIDVNGEGTHEVYKYLKQNSELFNKKKKTAEDIPWNFAKFLVSQDGKVHSFYHSRVNPADLQGEIEKLLA